MRDKNTFVKSLLVGFLALFFGLHVAQEIRILTGWPPAAKAEEGFQAGLTLVNTAGVVSSNGTNSVTVLTFPNGYTPPATHRFWCGELASVDHYPADKAALWFERRDETDGAIRAAFGGAGRFRGGPDRQVDPDVDGEEHHREEDEGADHQAQEEDVRQAHRISRLREGRSRGVKSAAG